MIIVILHSIEELRHEMARAQSFLEASEVQVRLNALYLALTEELQRRGIDRRGVA